MARDRLPPSAFLRAAFSTALLARWKRRQSLGRDQPGSVDGRPVTRDGRAALTPEEETVFHMLGMQPVPPERRSGEEWWRTVHRPLVSR
jgi:hypothetical protein